MTYENRAGVTASLLASALARVAPLVHRRTTVPALACVLVCAWGDRVTITATDLDAEACQVLDWPDAGHWAALVPCHAVLALLRKAAKGAEVTIAPDDTHVLIRIGRAETRLPMPDVNAFPLIAIYPGAGELRTDADHFTGLCKTVAKSMGKDEYGSMRGLNGARLDFRDDGPRLAATDGHRLSAPKVDGQVIGAPESFTLPREAVNLLAKLKVSGPAVIRPATVGHEDCVYGFTVTFEGLTLTAKAVNHPFPDYGKLIGQEEPGAVLLAGDLRRAIELVRIVAPGDKDRAIALELDGTELRIFTRDGAGADGETILDVTPDAGATIAFGLSSAALLNAMLGIEDDEPVRIMACGSTAVVRSVTNPGREAITAAKALPDAPYVEPVEEPETVCFIDADHLARRAARLQQAVETFADAPAETVGWTRKVLGLKLAPECLSTPEATMGHRNRAVRALAKTRLGQVARAAGAATTPPREPPPAPPAATPTLEELRQLDVIPIAPFLAAPRRRAA